MTKVGNTPQTAANGIAKPQSTSSKDPSSNAAEHLTDSPVLLGTIGDRKGYYLPSSLSVPHGQTESSGALVELDDSLDEEIAKLTNALSGVGI